MAVQNYQAVVQWAEDKLRAINKGPDGAFSVVNLAAVQIRASGDLSCGVLEKTGGNRSRDRAVDILAFRQGDGTLQLVDCIVASGDPDARVAWQLSDVLPDQSRWREPYPADAGNGEQPHDPPPPADLLAKLDAIEAKLNLLGACLDGLRPLLDQAAFESKNAAVRALDIAPLYAAVQGIVGRGVSVPIMDISIGIPYIGTARGTATPRGQK